MDKLQFKIRLIVIQRKTCVFATRDGVAITNAILWNKDEGDKLYNLCFDLNHKIQDENHRDMLIDAFNKNNPGDKTISLDAESEEIIAEDISKDEF